MSAAYRLPQHVQFVADMEEAGLDVELYRGRSFYCGPAVRVNALQDALSLTRVRCNYDQMGRGYVVHPRASDDSLREDA